MTKLPRKPGITTSVWFNQTLPVVTSTGLPTGGHSWVELWSQADEMCPAAATAAVNSASRRTRPRDPAVIACLSDLDVVAMTCTYGTRTAPAGSIKVISGGVVSPGVGVKHCDCVGSNGKQSCASGTP